MTLPRKQNRLARQQNMTPTSFAIRLFTIVLTVIAPQYHSFAFGFELASSCRSVRRSTFVCSFPPNTINNDAHTPCPSDLNNINVEAEPIIPKDYFISEALFVHLGLAAQILTDAFYSHRTNFVTFQIEKLKTALSLESTYAKQRANPMGQMFVACSSRDGQVVGFAEVDTCSLKNESCNEVKECGLHEDSSFHSTKSDLPRPYMYNLAVDKRWKRKGIATSLVVACEQFVGNIEDGDLDSSRWLYLRVRKSNVDAIVFYEKLGYNEIDPESIDLTKEDVNSGSAEEGELILMGKQLIS
ncbi:hypothetical protein HJC23_006612 [Cyclotella cryptica]|uniref:N-acetyltransferase domain-containing protein n=1 Tax=Cyclotella cryptica TaxID=29204 RepID=A0ABD3R6B7_9STRA|eukprot:CCRYP_001037-RA/>CCRYP_001037-RA protein AED:0.02 eAED:0.02 QI:174/1/1/1/1/1/2/1530/298